MWYLCNPLPPSPPHPPHPPPAPGSLTSKPKHLTTGVFLSGQLSGLPARIRGPLSVQLLVCLPQALPRLSPLPLLPPLRSALQKQCRAPPRVPLQAEQRRRPPTPALTGSAREPALSVYRLERSVQQDQLLALIAPMVVEAAGSCLLPGEAA